MLGLLLARWSSRHYALGFSNSIISGLLWIVLGEAILSQFAMNSPILMFLAFISVVCLPSIFIGLAAASLISVALHANVVGSYALLALSLAFTLSQALQESTVKNIKTTVRQSFKQRVFQRLSPFPKGKVTLTEFLNNR